MTVKAFGPVGGREREGNGTVSGDAEAADYDDRSVRVERQNGEVRNIS